MIRRQATIAAAGLVAAALVVPLPGAVAQKRGKEIFTNAEPPCAVCHVLSDAAATGRIGPSLDQLKPTEEQVRKAIRTAPGAMPEYENLSDEDISAVARYVARVARGGS